MVALRRPNKRALEKAYIALCLVPQETFDDWAEEQALYKTAHSRLTRRRVRKGPRVAGVCVCVCVCVCVK